MRPTPAVTVAVLLGARAEALGLRAEVVAGAAGLSRPITSPHIQKTGLALAGYDEYLHAGRVLVFGQSEVRFLDRQGADERRSLTERALGRGVPCLIATNGQRPPPEVAAACEAHGVALLVTPGTTGGTIARLTALLEDSLAERQIVHAVLMDLLGLGVLITGESGIGKSECALDLIMRGHRLVADDTVQVRRRAETVVIGTSPDLTRHHMELRGLGLINVRELFGIAAVRSSKRVELVVQLERWEPGHPYERLGLDDAFDEILGVRIPLVRMPVAPGRGVSTLVEVAARNQLLRSRGHHAARVLARRLDAQLRRAAGDVRQPGAAAPDDGTEAE
jgi:HPr kinase/phosphorylase